MLNLHYPPRTSNLDTYQLLRNNLSPITKTKQPIIGPTDNTAVRAAIKHYQPILSLHGHIHESRGVARIGPTVAINPDNEYPDGVLRGALVDLDANGMRSYVLTAG